MSLNIYFGGSMRAGHQDVHIYYDIIKQLKTYGHVLTEFVGEVKHAEVNLFDEVDDKTIHDEDVAMLERCDCMVAEVTVPSLGVGYEIGRAVAMNKRILCLYRPQKDKLLSGMIRGAHNGTTFIVTDYSQVSEIPEILSKYFESFK
uniref:Putative 2'-deoxynucleoside 5'-phosphate N-hydrolase 1 n=1 Tax=Arion vulgaris TaxID=1028688 RepID=A0A0B7BUL9_9EUPU